MSTATATMPTPEQLRAYADQMPAVYRDILIAVPLAAPGRRVGEGVSARTVKEYLRVSPLRVRIPSVGPEVRADDITAVEFDDALDRLAEAGFLIDPNDTPYGAVVPTELGEQLIAAVSGIPLQRIPLPDLPTPNW